MTRTKSEQIVIKAVIKAVPEIMELKFGCEMRRMDFLLKYVGKNNGQHALLITGKQELLFVDKIEEAVEILGRPIRLADVLLAIQETHIELAKVNHETLRITPTAEKVTVKGYGFWNLRADSLSEQSDETIHFLAELFSKGE